MQVRSFTIRFRRHILRCRMFLFLIESLLDTRTQRELLCLPGGKKNQQCRSKPHPILRSLKRAKQPCHKF